MFLTFHPYSLRKDRSAGALLSVLPNISEQFFAKHLCVTASAKYPFFLRYVDLSQKKRFLQAWLF